ncbi:unannotated protein [freshwater metagenome]|uniref:Unannotated protein n=1 Tax=freshwater metagenome TaxID=449393 RepID=A0A6J7V2P9_9ZZZZ|nr:hypothetical protein [Actinomycetota bacterium]MSW25681.1 hypothetical protein [Actinomycetota bacterium]MSW33413.1 hypothetical protein [Actinomycetota bacterium]MSX30437.1 hypothetical protein [Actinomycetota bacterium]MSX51331.1 hypothetical protein [Actinomycetota bacterium]
MRSSFSQVTAKLIEEDPRVIVLLGDIGVYSFNDPMTRFPDRVLNVGILEQSMIGMAAGLAMEGFIPIIHSIAPFLIERSLEQIKIDFGYQRLRGNLVSVGASFDYSALGATHHAPGDVGILLNIPGIQIFIPGTSKEFEALFRNAYANDKINYFRLSEKENSNSHIILPGEILEISAGSDLTVLAIGPTLDAALALKQEFDVQILYTNSLNIDGASPLKSLISTPKLLVLEPFYVGTTAPLVMDLSSSPEFEVHFHGVKREFIRDYGSMEDIEEQLGLTQADLHTKVSELLNA